MHLALLLAVLGTLVFIGQSWLLAHVFAGLLAGHPHSESLTQVLSSQVLLLLMLCFILRPSLQFARERLAQVASFQARATFTAALTEHLSPGLGPERQTLGADGALSNQLLEQVDALDGYISRYSRATVFKS